MNNRTAHSRTPSREAGVIMRWCLLLLAALLAGVWPDVASAYEEPDYSVVRREEGFELRRYAPYLVAETDAPGNFDDSRSGAFRRLFDYISGENVAKQQIEMTVPVVASRPEDTGVKIEMTAPVVTQAAAEGRTMQFVLPSRYTLETAPLPSHPRVRIRALDERWIAVRSYSGTWSERNYRKNEAALLEHLETAGLIATGPTSFAGYNSPFTPWFMRRNEVMIPVRSPVP